MRTLQQAEVRLSPAQDPRAVLLVPEVMARAASTPTATLPVPKVALSRALQPRAVFLVVVQPKTMPWIVGVAETTLAGAQVRPVGQAEHTTKENPSVEPTGRATGVLAAVPTISDPLAVTQAFGM
jgi:hypothetical protein